MSAYTWGRGFIAGAHLGVDMVASSGTPIHAIAGGRVAYAGDTRSDPHAPWWSFWQGAPGAAGIAVSIDAGNGRTELYAHMSRLGIAPGATVAAGQVIGYVGMTGNATGPHVHYGVIDGTLFRDPETIWTRAQLLAGVAGAGVTNATTTSAIAGAPSSVAVPYGRAFRTYWNPPVSPSYVIDDALNAAWAQLIVEQYPQNTDPSSPLYWFGIYLSHFGADRATIDAFNATVKAECIAAAAPWKGHPVSAAPDTLSVGLPAQTSATGDLLSGIAGAIGGAIWLVAILAVVILGLYLTLAPSPGGTSS